MKRMLFGFQRGQKKIASLWGLWSAASSSDILLRSIQQNPVYDHDKTERTHKNTPAGEARAKAYCVLRYMRVPLTATTKLVGVQCRLWLALVGRVAPFPSTKIIERPGPVNTKKPLFDYTSHYSSSGPVFEKAAIGIVTNFGKPNNAFLYFRDLAVRLISLYRTRAFIGLHLSV